MKAPILARIKMVKRQIQPLNPLKMYFFNNSRIQEVKAFQKKMTTKILKKATTMMMKRITLMKMLVM